MNRKALKLGSTKNRKIRTKSHKTVRVTGVILAIATIFAVFAGTVDLRSSSPSLPPKVVSLVELQGELQVGAAKADLVPPMPVTVAGYVLPRPEANSAGPLFARAIVITDGQKAVGIASAEVLFVPSVLVQQVKEKAKGLGIDEVIVTATHTHSSFGGYERHPFAQWAATGWYDQTLAEHLVSKIVSALSQAYAAKRPATISVGQVSVSGVSRNRNDSQGSADETMTMVLVKEKQDKTVARLLVFGAHPTLVHRKGNRLDGDWPGRAMEKLESGGGVAMLMQGAVGDVSAQAPAGIESPPDWVGQRVAESFRKAETLLTPITEVGVIEVGVTLPAAEVGTAVPPMLRTLSSNFLDLFRQDSASLEVLNLGKYRFLFSPAESTVAAAKELQARLFSSGRSTVVGLAQGYVGYLETSENMQNGKGETKRTLWGKELFPRMEAGFEAGIKALEKQ